MFSERMDMKMEWPRDRRRRKRRTEIEAVTMATWRGNRADRGEPEAEAKERSGEERKRGE